MSDVRTSTVRTRIGDSRVLEKGTGSAVVYLAGLGGVPTWLPFLDLLAEKHRVVVPALPGFPAGADGFHQLDDHLDWLTATLDLLDATGVSGSDVVASSVAGMLAADVAALAHGAIGRLVLIDPWGLYDPAVPGRDYFGETPENQPGLVSTRPDLLAAALAAPEGSDPVDATVEAYRASEAAARLSWPMGDRGLSKRLHRITQPTLIIWGENDQILPSAYAGRFAAGITGPTEVVIVAAAGHQCAIDQPEETAEHVARFLVR